MFNIENIRYVNARKARQQLTRWMWLARRGPVIIMLKGERKSVLLPAGGRAAKQAAQALNLPTLSEAKQKQRATRKRPKPTGRAKP